MMKQIMAYFAVSIPSDQGSRIYDMDIQRSEDGSRLFLTSHYPVEAEQRLWFAVWGQPDWDNDLAVYPGDLDEEGIWHCTVPLDAHGEKGMFYIHARVGDADDPPEEGTVIMKWYYIE